MKWYGEMYSKAKEGAYSLWQRGIFQSTAAYTMETASYIVKQVTALPRLAASMVRHEGTRRVAKQVLQVAAYDVAPIVIGRMAQAVVQQKIAATTKNPDEPSDWSDLMLVTFLNTLSWGVWILVLRKRIGFQTHVLLLNLEAPLLINDDRHDQAVDDVCQREKCSSARVLQGIGRDLVEFYATEAAILGIGYLPYGEAVSASLSVYHRGRYLLTIIWPELCNRHQMMSLSVHSALALSLGIGIWGANYLSLRALDNLIQVPNAFYTSELGMWAANYLSLDTLKTLTQIPMAFYARELGQLLFFLHMGIARHMHLPKAAANTSSSQDPLSFFQEKIIGKPFDVMCLGLKVSVQRALKQGSQRDALGELLNLSWAKYLNKTKGILHHPVLRYSLLPSVFHDYEHWSNDLILRDCWPGLLQRTINVLHQIEITRNKPLIQIALLVADKLPDQTVTALNAFFGLHRDLVRIALILVTHRQLMEQISLWRRDLQHLNGQPALDAEFQMVDRPTEEPEPLQRLADVDRLPPAANDIDNGWVEIIPVRPAASGPISAVLRQHGTFRRRANSSTVPVHAVTPQAKVTSAVDEEHERANNPFY
jgi:hypothetical protein